MHFPQLTLLPGILPALGATGFFLFIGIVTILALVGVVPGALLGMLAGAIYGVAAGFVASAAGVMAGAVIAFWLGRSLLRPLITALLGRRARLAILDDLVRQDRWRLVMLLRVCPVLPFSLTSYALGLCDISFRDYCLGTLAALPPLAGYVFIGTLGRLAATPSHGAALLHDVILAAGIAGTLALMVRLTAYFGRIAKPA